MNQEFGNIVKIFLKNQVDKIVNQEVIPKAGELPVTVYAADFELNKSTTDNKASLLTSTPISLYVDKLSDNDADIFRIKRSVIIQLCKSNDENIVIGSLKYPAQLIFTTSLNQDIIKITHKHPSYLDR